jgi:lipopolysaccharide export system permease protein
MSAMISILLVFGRMSADSEITAMKSCGLGLWQIASAPLVFSLGLAVICFFIYSFVVPRSYALSKHILRELKSSVPLAILEEGRFTQPFPGVSIYIGNRKDDVLHDVRIFKLMKSGGKQKINAETGKVRIDEKSGKIIVDLTGVRIDPFMEGRRGVAYLEEWTLEFPGKRFGGGVNTKPIYFTAREVIERIKDTAKYFPLLDKEAVREEHSRLVVEFNLRIVQSLACVVFVLLGIPLGVKTHRKESSIGIAMSLMIIVFFQIFMIAGESLSRKPEFYPQLVLWIPIIVGEFIGIILMQRAD